MSICTCVRMNAVCVCDPCVSIVYTCMRVHEERRKREREIRGGEGKKIGSRGKRGKKMNWKGGGKGKSMGKYEVYEGCVREVRETRK